MRSTSRDSVPDKHARAAPDNRRKTAEVAAPFICEALFDPHRALIERHIHYVDHPHYQARC